MDGKLIKKEDDFYSLRVDGLVMATSNGMLVDYKLSIKNCEAIANGYDLDEIIEQTKQTLEDSRISSYDSFRIGMETILKILGDKKFSEEDILKAIAFDQYHFEYGEITSYKKDEEKEEFIQSLQQTEWDVDIVMEYQGFEEEGKVREAYLPKLDAERCLILKRKL